MGNAVWRRADEDEVLISTVFAARQENHHSARHLIPSLESFTLLTFAPHLFIMVKAIALFALLAPLGANAHYIFNRLIVNGAAMGGDYAYTRKNSNSYMPSIPSELMNSNDLRCNKGATAGNTATYTVKAGDKLGFKLFNNEFIEHPGPGFVYVSKAPGSVKSYDGSGDWTKVMQSGLKNPSTPGVDTAWDSWQKDRLEWTIQKNIPAGEYLVRVEHIGLHEGHVGKAQFYIECFQLKIESSGTGTLGPAVKFPGAYKAADPGIAFNKVCRWYMNFMRETLLTGFPSGIILRATPSLAQPCGMATKWSSDVDSIVNRWCGWGRGEKERWRWR
jgi:hypothetical protein